MTLAFSCEVVHEKLWKSVNICKSYSKKNQWHLVFLDTVQFQWQTNNKSRVINSIRVTPFSWPWTTTNSDLKVAPLFDAEYLRNGTRYRHSSNRKLMDSHTPHLRVSFRMILSDLETLSEIFNDTKHRAVSLRQLSFLFSLQVHWEYKHF